MDITIDAEAKTNCLKLMGNEEVGLYALLKDLNKRL